MKAYLIKNVRMWVIAIFAMACLVCLAGEPINEEQWLKVFIQSKLLAFGFEVQFLMVKVWAKH